MGRTVLGLDEHTFWRCTLKKLGALIEAHNQINSEEGRPDFDVSNTLTMADLMAWGGG